MRTGGSGDQPRLALVGESRDEFLFLRRVALRVNELLGREAALQIEMEPSDLSPTEQGWGVLPRLEPEFASALALPERELPGRIADAEERFEIESLRRLWLADLQHWRDKVPEQHLARQALGYLEVIERVHRENPGLVGGFAEDSTRLIKRAFRAVTRHHGLRFAVALPFAIPDRVVLVDHENLEEIEPSFDEFQPTPDELERAVALIEAVRASRRQYAEPRDLRLTPRRVRNFAAMAWGNVRGGVGRRNPELLFYSTRDYVLQRSRIAMMRRYGSAEVAVEDAVFFPLHYANDSQVAIRGEQYKNQFALAEQVAEALPYGTTLLLKPHPHFAGQVAIRWLRHLRREHENVELLLPGVHAHQVIPRVRAVVTINSTTGFEAAMFGVPVVTLGASLYRGKGVTYDVRDPAELRAKIAAALDEDGPSADAVARMLAYLERVSVPIKPMGYDLSSENASAYGDTFVEDFGLRR